MKKTFKGFTLVECLVAMAILAIAGTLMAGIYARVSSRNNFNHFMNTSLANQMSYIEKYTDTASVAVYYGGGAKPVKDPQIAGTRTPPHGHVTDNKGTSAYVQIDKLNSSGSVVSTDKYSFPVDIYVMYSRDTQNDASTNVTVSGGSRSVSANTSYGVMFSEDDSNLRYKYILGHTTT